ncbi:MAG: DUF5996 family protein, partial [Terriglobales bacterium]
MKRHPPVPPLPDLGVWPMLEWDQWQETAETLHMYTQIVGKMRLALTPVQNHWWNVPLYLSARGLTTSAMAAGRGTLLDIEFDFIAHELVLRLSDGRVSRFPLGLASVAQFYAASTQALSSLGITAT